MSICCRRLTASVLRLYTASLKATPGFLTTKAMTGKNLAERNSRQMKRMSTPVPF